VIQEFLSIKTKIKRKVTKMKIFFSNNTFLEEYHANDLNDNSERTPMKNHLQKDLKENLKTNEGIERVSFDEVKLEMYKESEEKRSQSCSNSKLQNKKRDVYHDIKNFDNVINHKSKFVLENNRIEE